MSQIPIPARTLILRPRGVAVLALVVLFTLCTATDQAAAPKAGEGQNPFLRAPVQPALQAGPTPAWPPHSPARTPPQQASPEPARPKPLGRFWEWIQQTQHELHRKLAAGIRRLRKEQAAAAAFALILISFVYGVVHAIGPGHGKAVISSYVLASERTVRRGIALSFAASLVQALSAIAIVSILAAALNAAGFLIKEQTARLETASYGLIALIGAWMLTGAVKERLGGRKARQAGHAHHGPDHSHVAGQPCGCGHQHMPDASALELNWSLRKAAALVLAVGIRPCSGAIIVLVFALAQGMFWAGVASTFAMSIGTAITVSAFAALAVGSREMAVRFGGGNGVWTERIRAFAALGGAFLVFLLGVTLFVASLGPARPF